MKIILTESQILKVYFKYLDLLMKNIEKNHLKSDENYKVFYNDGVRTFLYSDRSEDVYFLESVIRDFHSMFSDLEGWEVLYFIGKWIEHKFGYHVRQVYPTQRMLEN